MSLAEFPASVSRRSILLRILDSYSAGTYAWQALLGIVEVVESEAVEKAAVECRPRPRLLIKPGFVERHAETPEKLLMLVMHELHHVLLGHTRLFPRASWLDNFAFDCVINALLCRMFPQVGHLALLTDYYRADRFPECLLRPPPGWDAEGTVPLPPALCEHDDFALQEVYRGLYSWSGVSYDELIAALVRAVPLATLQGARLLGDHRAAAGGGPSESGLGNHVGLLLDIVREMAGQWPEPPASVCGRSLGGVLQRRRVVPCHVAANRRQLRKLILETAGWKQTGGATRRVADEDCAIVTPLPRHDRRAMVLSALGRPPLLYRGTVGVRRPRRVDPWVHLYLDVSGSVTHLQSALYGAVLDCRAVLHPAIHLFSTDVEDVSLASLRRGDCRTTGGTNIACVAAHARRHHVRRAVIVTDGHVGFPTRRDTETLQKIVLGTALAGDKTNHFPLQPVTDYWAEL